MGIEGDSDRTGIFHRQGHDARDPRTDDSTMAASGMMDDSKVADISVPMGKNPLDPYSTTLEDAYMDTEIPRWQDQITVRAFVVSAMLGIVFSIITHNLSLTVGVIPSLNVSAGLLGFFFVKLWTSLSQKLGFFTTPFTRQENTVIQTCVVSCYGLAFSGKTTLSLPYYLVWKSSPPYMTSS